MSKQAKTKKLLILGSSGMLAADLVKIFKADKRYRLTAWDRDKLDITNEEDVNKKISKLKPDVIINAAGYTAVDKCEMDFDTAMAVNGYALRFLVEVARKAGALLVHYSTDYVFDGENPKGYKENDEPNPISAYGQSKFAGEQMILLTAMHNTGGCGGCAMARECSKIEDKKPLKFYIIRTSWLYGPSSLKLRQTSKNGQNFVETMLALSQKLSELKVVNDQRGKPTYTLDLAKKTKDLIESKLPFDIYHFTNKTPKRGITWYDFAREIFSACGGSAAGGRITKKVRIIPVSTKEFYGADKTRLAKRPKYSMLINTKTAPLRGWKKALKDYLKENKKVKSKNEKRQRKI